MEERYGKEWDAEKKKLVNRKWKPKFGEEYFVVNTIGRIDYYRWEDDTIDNGFYNLGNCFATMKEAEVMREKFMKLLKGDKQR